MAQASASRVCFLDPFHRGLLTIGESGVPVPGGVVPVPGGGLPVPGGGVAVGDRCPAVLPDLVQKDPDIVPLLGEDPALVHRLLPGHRCLAPPRGQLTGISVGRSCGAAGNVERPAFPGRAITLAGRPHPLLHHLIPQHRGLIPSARGNVSSSGVLTTGLRGTVPGTGRLITVVGVAVTLIGSQLPVST
jgi:hypothetical protein